jgi:hypothetical protein
MPRIPGRDADPCVTALASLLCRYWRRNPLACDMPDFIAQWWLPAGHGATVAQVHAALEALEERKLIERVVGGDGRIRYRLREQVAMHLHLLDLDPGAPTGGLH